MSKEVREATVGNHSEEGLDVYIYCTLGFVSNEVAPLHKDCFHCIDLNGEMPRGLRGSYGASHETMERSVGSSRQANQTSDRTGLEKIRI